MGASVGVTTRYLSIPIRTNNTKSLFRVVFIIIKILNIKDLFEISRNTPYNERVESHQI